MKKTVSLVLCVALMASVLLTFPVSAATNSNKNVVRPAQYTSVGPNDSGAQIVYRETFDGVSSPEAAGYFPGYLDYGDQPAHFIPACDLSLVSGHSGKGLKVSNRDKIYGKQSKSGKVSQLDHTGGEFSFVVTNNYPKKGATEESAYVTDKSGSKKLTAYEQVSNTGGGKDIGAIIGKYLNDVKDKQDVSFFFSMWVYTDTAQTFLPKIQYMGTNELWIPADDYWEVPAKKWTQIGAIVQDGKTYYCSMVGEGGSEAYGMYGSMPATTESKFCMATKSKDASGNVSFTNGDYIIDDITIWKVSDKAKLYDMQYTMMNGSTYTGLDGLVKIDNKDDIKSKKVVNCYNVSKPTTKATAKPTTKAGAKTTAAKQTAKKPVATKAPTTSVKVVKKTNASGQVIGTQKVVVTEAAATATGTGTGTGTGTAATATGTGTGTEATVITSADTSADVTTSAEETETTRKAKNASVDEEESNTGLLIGIIAGGVALIAAAVAVYVVLTKKKKGEE